MRKYIIYAFVMCTVTTACVQNKTEQTKQVTEINLEPEISTTPNTLSTQEIDEGWKLLWDGKTTEGWRGARLSEFPNNGWTIEDGLLKVRRSVVSIRYWMMRNIRMLNWVPTAIVP